MKINTISLKSVFMAVALWGSISNTQPWGRVMQLSDFTQKGETPRQTYDRVIAENDYVVVKFYLTYCKPCKVLAPEFTALAQQYKDVLFIEIDAGTYDSLSTALNVRSAPTLMLYKNHQQFIRWSGGDKQRLRSEVSRLLQ